MPGSRALVLVSGGLDSAVAYAWAVHAGHEPVALTFHYPERPRGEVLATRHVAGERELHEVELPFLRETSRAGAPPGYVPARNAMYYAIAAHHAQQLRCPIVVGGHHAEDARAYPDASGGFFADLERLLARGLWLPPGERAPRLVMPLIDLDHAGVVALGQRLGVRMERTWSCYEDGDAPCGTCPACARRSDVPTEVRVVARSTRPTPS